MGGDIPDINSRDQVHVWNYLWELYKEFGLDGPDYSEMKDYLKDLGIRYMYIYE